MVADDGKGQHRSFLANEENFQVLKELHEKNLLVPVVGNFAGPKALRAVGRYLKERDALVSAFYLSNVEQYLEPRGLVGQRSARTWRAAARRDEHVHPLGPQQHVRARRRPRLGDREHARRSQGLPRALALTPLPLRQLRQHFSQPLDFLAVQRPVPLALRLHCALVDLARLQRQRGDVDAAGAAGAGRGGS